MRGAADSLSPTPALQRIAAEPWRYDFFQAMRLIENQFPDQPRFGTARRPADEPIRLGQTADLSFAPSPLHADEGDAVHQRQIDGLRSVGKRQIVRRLPMPGPIAFGRGVELELGVDELAFQGASAFLLGCVLERFFARHVSINSFTETRVRSMTRGEIMVGRPRCGARPIL